MPPGATRELYHRARALQNGVFFVFVADAVGGPQPFRFGGGSAVYDPEGHGAAESTRARHAMLLDVAAARPDPQPPARLRVG